MTETQDFVVAAHATLSDSELQFLPVTALLGVTGDMAAKLSEIGIDTVRDLGLSRVFAQAGAVLANSRLEPDAFPGDLLKALQVGETLADAASLPLERLHGLDEATAQALSQVLGTNTLRAFALWAPYRGAHAIVGKSAADPEDEDEDPAAEKLRPIIGQFPTENSYYSTLIMLGTVGEQQLDPLTGPLSLDRLLGQSAVFGTPAIGAIATYVQSWVSQGVTLGHMLHSLALAPGEATRIAVIDWSRTTAARVAESVGETEALTSSQTHARSISEIQTGVANEMQSGGSSSNATSTSTSEASASAAAGGFGLAIGPVLLGGGGGATTNDQSATTTTTANTTSWTRGHRDIVSNLEQVVNDRTEQQANVVRNRRASSVREVSQSEHEQISTRIVANYNHMHALTVQYYEVVQAYMVSTRLHAFDRAIFLPFALLDFSGSNAADIVARFRAQLIRGALSQRARSLLIDDRGQIQLRGAVRFTVPGLTHVAVTADPVAVASRVAARSAVPTTEVARSDAPVGVGSLPVATATILRSAILSHRPGPLIDTVAGDAVLEAVSFEDIGIDILRLDREGVPADQSSFEVSRQTARVELPNELLLREITGAHVRRSDGADLDGTMVLHLRTEGRTRPLEIPLLLSDRTSMQRAVYVAADSADRRAELLQHLQLNRAHYTQTVFSHLDTPALIQLLAGLSFQGSALTEQIEPRVEAVIGNYLVLPAPVNAGDDVTIGSEIKAWQVHMRERGISFEKVNRRLISVPTGGVFAEAVLGRSNSAEKLDITRFWNWQDSPIPLTPPEIAPVAAASRSEAETLTPGQLSGPVLTVQNPITLPDPAGLGAILGALSTGDTFRNLSGLEGTQTLAGSVSANTLTAATEAGKLASANFSTAASLAGNLANAAVQTIAAGSKGDATAKKASGGISGDGAKINEGKKQDKQNKAEGSSAGGTRFGDNLLPPAFASGVSRGIAALDTAISGNSPGLNGEVLSQFQKFASSAQTASAPVTTPVLQGGGPGILGGLQNFVRDPIGSIYLTMIELLCDKFGIKLRGASLERMSDHKHGTEFQALFGAWTDSAGTIYVNEVLWSSGITADAIRTGLRIAHHEAVHVDQFINNQNSPPATFEEMIGFEKASYTDDLNWANDTSATGLNGTMAAIDPSLVFSNQELAAIKKSASGDLAKLNAMITSAPAQPAAAREAHFRTQLTAQKFLPATITVGGQPTSTYAANDLYGP